MTGAAARLAEVIDRWAALLNLPSKVLAVIAATIAALIMLLVVSNVLSRYFLNDPVAGTVEYVRGMMVFLVFLPWALVQANKGHIQVTFLLDRLSPRRRAVLELITLASMLLFVSLITWQSWEFAWQGIQENERFIGPVYTPAWPSRIAITVGAALFSLVVLSDIWRTARNLFARRLGDTADAA